MERLSVSSKIKLEVSVMVPTIPNSVFYTEKIRLRDYALRMTLNFSDMGGCLPN